MFTLHAKPKCRNKFPFLTRTYKCRRHNQVQILLSSWRNIFFFKKKNKQKIPGHVLGRDERNTSSFVPWPPELKDNINIKMRETWVAARYFLIQGSPRRKKEKTLLTCYLLSNKHISYGQSMRSKLTQYNEDRYKLASEYFKIKTGKVK